MKLLSISTAGVRCQGCTGPPVKGGSAGIIQSSGAIVAVNAQLRKVAKKRDSFPNPEAVGKVLCLALPYSGWVPM